MRSLALTVGTVALLILATPRVGAETWQAPDARHDVQVTRITVPAQRAEPCPEVTRGRAPQDRRRDIVEFGVDHGTEAVTLTLTMRETRARDRRTFFSFHLRTPDHAFFVDYTAGGPRELRLFLAREPHYPDPSDIGDCGLFGTSSTGVACEGLTGATDESTGVVVVTVPRRCLKDPAWVRSAVSTSGTPDRQLPASHYAIFSDYWAPRGVAQHGFLPPFGPRVRSSQVR